MCGCPLNNKDRWTRCVDAGPEEKLNDFTRGCARRDRLIRLGCFIIRSFFSARRQNMRVQSNKPIETHPPGSGGPEVFGEDGWSLSVTLLEQEGRAVSRVGEDLCPRVRPARPGALSTGQRPAPRRPTLEKRVALSLSCSRSQGLISPHLNRGNWSWRQRGCSCSYEKSYWGAGQWLQPGAGSGTGTGTGFGAGSGTDTGTGTG